MGERLLGSIQGKQFLNAEALIDATAKTKERMADGQWVGSKLLNGYAAALKQSGRWDEQLALIQLWREGEPESGAAALVEATYWEAYAWFARGGEFAANVPREAFKIVDGRMAKARAALEQSKAYAAQNPAWYVRMLGIASYQGWPRAERLALFDEAVRVEPLYDATYLSMAEGLTPRWGGSLDDYHRFVRGAVEKTKPSAGNTMYARLYWVLINTESDQEPFTALGVPWDRMKSGFEDLMARYPDSQWNLQHYAYFACRADDGATFSALLPKLEVKLPYSMPPPWRGAYTRSYCVTRLGESKAR